ncbi:NAD(P)-binding protein [Mycena indigotica]|uniref:NAD(P)-binding protein n=1 Tax=Mycena indigotica TaxID=2126181 RepID=A0A8H6S4G1_9AGAR|nr:NAD(P)-binding protein [Mycena indigotica]KAF7292573.1 NAD(P)-binding protein [Mycena indigotica]
MADKVLEQLKAQNIFDLRGVVAVVTGGGSGIGMMISSTLVANGATVYIIGPKQQELDAVCAKYNEAAEGISNGRMHGLEGDIRLKSEATRLASEISTRSPEGVTVLFNNAGISSPAPGRPTINADGTPPSAADFVAAYFDSVTQEQFTDVFATNAVGPFWLTFAFLPLLEKWKSSTNKFVPQVIMTSSMNGWTKDSATCGHSYPYLFSKMAIGQATATLANELLPLGIRVNGIAPGLFLTGMSLGADTIDALGSSGTLRQREFGFSVPTETGHGSARDVGAVALSLVVNSFVNGETILVDGGTLLKHPSSW